MVRGRSTVGDRRYREGTTVGDRVTKQHCLPGLRSLKAARGPAADWGELVQVHDDREIVQGRIDELPAIDIHSL
jgi:hypothetical protein